MEKGNEKIRRHWITYVIPGFIALVALVGAIVELEPGALIVIAIIVVPCLIDFFFSYLEVTDTQIKGRTGFIKSKTMASPLRAISDVSVSNGLFGKILGYGNVSITTASGVYLFKRYANASKFQDIVMARIDGKSIA